MIYAATRTSLVQHLNGILSPGQLLVNSQVHSREEFTKDWLKQEMTHSTAVGVEAEKLRELVMNDKEKMVKEMRLEAVRTYNGFPNNYSHQLNFLLIFRLEWTTVHKLARHMPLHCNFHGQNLQNEL